MEPKSKKDIKIDKTHRKNRSDKKQINKGKYLNSQLSEIQLERATLIENEANIPSSYLDIQSQNEKVIQWWSNIDETYFKPVKKKNILLTRDLTSAEKLINYFTLETQLQSSFENEEIYSKLPLLRQNHLLHVIFQSSTSYFVELVTFSYANFLQNSAKKNPLKNISEQSKDNQTESLNFKILSQVKKLKKKQRQNQDTLQLEEQSIKAGNLQFQGILQDQDLIIKLEKFQSIKYDTQYDEDIDVQLQLWKSQALDQNIRNSILWSNLLHNFQNSFQPQQKNLLDQVYSIKEALMYYTILRYIEHGTKDKTQQMLKQMIDSLKLIKPAKSRQAYKKFFQTDCKICFCSFNSDSNQVLYCDMCNTSFHLACYGLHEVPKDKEYFCDRCTEIKKNQKTKNNITRITCQICCKPNFPIKEIDGHYYHMTCLILFNLITIRSSKIQLRDGLTHEKITKKVIQNQLDCESCVFCVDSQSWGLGMQLKCNFNGCTVSMHPICAYINGCIFDVKKNMKEKNIEVTIYCNGHDCERDYIQQTYLRRYMCNFKNTSQKSLQQFQLQHQLELSFRTQKLQSIPSNNQSLPQLIIDTKIIRKHINLRQQKSSQKNQVVQNTEIRKIIQKIQKTKFKP